MSKQLDLRKALNAISDVIVNRPPPLREFDQIYMKAADMLMQAAHVAKWVHERDMVCIGDGDALGLCVVHLHNREFLDHGPRSLHVLDFDERVVNSVMRFAEIFDLTDRVSATLYNVGDSLPVEHQRKYGAFYTNPPFGGSNEGASVLAFFQRGFEATGADAVAVTAIADYQELAWCDDVLRRAQLAMIENQFTIAEMIPVFHHYHLDDNPNLTSCSLVGRRRLDTIAAAESRPLDSKVREDFYGRGAALKIRYVRDNTNGGKLASRDHKMEAFPEG